MHHEAEIIKLKISSKPTFIRKIRKVIEEVCQRSGFSPKQILELKLTINEALANIIQHAYENRPNKPIYIYFLLHPERIEVIIRDFGKKPDTDHLRYRDLKDLQDNGLGLLFMKRFADFMTFDFSKKGENQVKFIKYKQKPA